MTIIDADTDIAAPSGYASLAYADLSRTFDALKGLSEFIIYHNIVLRALHRCPNNHAGLWHCYIDI